MFTHTQMHVPAHETWAAGVDTLTVDTAGVAILTADTHFSLFQFRNHFLVDLYHYINVTTRPSNGT